MKTLRALKIASIWNGIFCFCCIPSTVCFAIYRYSDSDIFFSLGNILLIFWIINLIPIISFVLSLVPFLAERKLPEAKQILGNKYILIFIWPVITIIFYLIAAVLLVEFTGGV